MDSEVAMIFLTAGMLPLFTCFPSTHQLAAPASKHLHVLPMDAVACTLACTRQAQYSMPLTLPLKAALQESESI